MKPNWYRIGRKARTAHVLADNTGYYKAAICGDRMTGELVKPSSQTRHCKNCQRILRTTK